MDQSPKSPNVWKTFETLTRRRRKEELDDSDIMTELEIMTENLRNIEVTPSAKKSFSHFQPDDYNLEEEESRVYIDPENVQGL